MKQSSLIALLAMLSAACGGTAMPGDTSTLGPPSGLPTRWAMTHSPLFPSEWPPTASTTWARYTFAYGTNPTTLMDGAYVTPPLTRTLVQRDGTDGAAVTLSTTLEEAGIQGVKPLDAASSAALGKGAHVQALCVQLRDLPDDAAAAELRGYYRVWVGLNGAFVKFIRPDHAAFFQWLESE